MRWLAARIRPGHHVDETDRPKAHVHDRHVAVSGRRVSLPDDERGPIPPDGKNTDGEGDKGNRQAREPEDICRGHGCQRTRHKRRLWPPSARPQVRPIKAAASLLGFAA